MGNKILIILGMHRSGTSLITNWLHQCGLQVGESLMDAGVGNKEGHFEDTEFYKMHMEILRDNNLNDSGIINQKVNYISSYHKEKIKGIIRVKNKLFGQWGWKDPRTCLFLKYYRELLPQAYYLVVIRDYHSVVVSLLKRTMAELDLHYDTQKGLISRSVWYNVRRKLFYHRFCRKHASCFLNSWIFYNENILENIKNMSDKRYLIVNYDMLKTRDREVLSFLNSHWHFSLNYARFSGVFKDSLLSKSFEVENYIDDKLLIKKADGVMEKLMNYTRDIGRETATHSFQEEVSLA
ncbi:sulfotransferase [Mucilaginibacter sp.]|uniref:sulfotransferase n=1 Tax=Mucilaginibacter sp. TaxID=1882438 RepID=UPI00283CD9B0|nr:hypothetical protein [Mucilaginibacter sp.]MDR3693564.1 hypothetical protein [Mucilaginibacter sp.]